MLRAVCAMRQQEVLLHSRSPHASSGAAELDAKENEVVRHICTDWQFEIG